MKINYIQESYFKNPDQMKKEIEKNKSISSVDKLAQNARKILVQKNLAKLDLNKVQNAVNNILINSKYDHYNRLFSKIVFPNFELLSDSIVSEYFDIHLVHSNDIVSRGEYFIEISLLYTGDVEVVKDYHNEPITLGIHGYPIVKSVSRSWPNPDIDIIKIDLETLKKYLEKTWPGIYFKIKFSVTSNISRTENIIDLVKIESSWDDIVKTMNNYED